MQNDGTDFTLHRHLDKTPRTSLLNYVKAAHYVKNHPQYRHKQIRPRQKLIAFNNEEIQIGTCWHEAQL
jgi:hypothetical protein